MIESFKQNPLLLLFLVSAIGYWVGNIRIRGSKLGVSAVLFVGLAFGALDPELSVPEIIIFMGLAIFVYTIGLSSGPSFFSTFQQRGLRDILFVIAMLIVSAGLTVGLFYVFELDAATAAGLFAGSSTNTPALAGLLDLIRKTAPDAELSEMAQQAVVGYSLSYPMGVLGVMLVIHWVQKALKISYKAEERALRKDYPLAEHIKSQTLLVTHHFAIGKTIRELHQVIDEQVVFGRIQRGGDMQLVSWGTRLQKDDLLVVITNEEAFDKVVPLIGKVAQEQLTYDRSTYDVRRFFVSNGEVAGQTIASLNLDEKFPVIITRVQRGDMDLLAKSDTVLELGDRVLSVARREDLAELRRIFGNSYRALSQIDLLSFGLGMALGLLLGMVDFQLPGGVTFNLGYAGGPLIVALILGQLRRTGSIVWTLPFGANLTLRQIGLIMLLAGIGIRSGHTFLATLQEGGGLLLFACGGIISITTALTTILIGYRLLGIPFSFLTGMVANQPAILDFALEHSKNQLPTIGFTIMLPVAMITKILFVQILFTLLS
ncbi:MAG: aspartate:alanine exchanger family transporter [Saprospiraceae bacterium]